MPIERATGIETEPNVGWVTTTSAPSKASTSDWCAATGSSANPFPIQ